MGDADLEDKSVVISHETLFELLRIERSRTELQELPLAFIDDINRMISSEIMEINSVGDESEKKKREIYLKNTLKIITEIYDRRERKIASLALDKSRTKSAIIDFSRLLGYEKEMFKSLVSVFDRFREDISKNLLPGKELTEESEKNRGFAGSIGTNSGEKAGKDIGNSGERMRTVRFLSAIPRFVGPKLEEYGPFDEEEIASLPPIIADILVEKKRAEEIIIQD